jgi:membrane protein DedA with SNARE-associated domain
MDEFLSRIIEFMLPLGNYLIYIFLFISSVIENIFPPAPGDTITAFGAFLVGTGRLNFVSVYAVTTLGSAAGFMILFFLGRYLERGFFEKKNYSFFPKDKMADAERWFQKYGYLVIVFNRFMPGLRSVISIVSGICGLRTVPVFFLCILSAMLWNLIWIYAGFTIGNNWDTVKTGVVELLECYNYAAGSLIFIVCMFLLIKYLRKKSAD